MKRFLCALIRFWIIVLGLAGELKPELEIQPFCRVSLLPGKKQQQQGVVKRGRDAVFNQVIYKYFIQLLLIIFCVFLGVFLWQHFDGRNKNKTSENWNLPSKFTEASKGFGYWRGNHLQRNNMLICLCYFPIICF